MLEISETLTRQLRELAQQEQSTLFAVLLTGFNVLLYRYTGQTDLCVGVPSSARTLEELQNLVGLFVNTLVLRTEVEERHTFREVVQHVRKTFMGAFAHADLPIGLVVKSVQPDRDLAQNPLFDVMFTFDQRDSRRVLMADIEVAPQALSTQCAKFALTLTVEDEGSRLAFHVEYDADRFEADVVRRMIRHLVNLLKGAVAEPEQSIARLPLMAEDERRELLEMWGDGGPPAAEPALLHALVEAHAARAPDATAVTFGGTSLTYAELDRQAGALAGHLHGLGVGRGDVVGVALRRTPELVVALLAVLKAGGAYLPLSPDDPPERLALMLNDAGAKTVLTHAPADECVAGWGGPAVRTDTDYDAAAPTVGVVPEDPAYVLYTSGSTGAPKGVVVPHRAATAYLGWATEAYGLGPASVAPVHTALGFDLTVTALWGPLVAGGRVDLLPEGEGVDALAAALEHGGGYDLVKLTPAHLLALQHHLALQHEASGALTAKRFVVGGEQLLGEAVAFWRERCPDVEVVNEYGPTEATVGCCTSSVPAGVPLPGPVPIGRPTPGTRLYVLDAHRHPVPVGVPGELHIGGAQLAAGYHNRPELTVERFVPDPFRAGERVYRTGDVVRWGPGGGLEYVGRTDDQVKVRGYRVELGEVEAALAEHPAVESCAVVLREDAPGDRRLVAYAVPSADGAAPSAAGGDGTLGPTLRQHARERLPAYMVPSHVVVLPALPLTRNGKVDRAALPPPDERRPELEGAYVAPRTEEERALAGVVAEVLRLERVGVHDNLFEIGADSMLVFQISAKAQRAGLKLAPRQFFHSQTVAELAQAAHEANVKAADADATLREQIMQMKPEEVSELLAKKRAEREGG